MSPQLLFVSSSYFRNRSLLVRLPCLDRVLRHRRAALAPEVQSTSLKLLPPGPNTRIFASGNKVEVQAMTKIDSVLFFDTDKVFPQIGF